MKNACCSGIGSSAPSSSSALAFAGWYFFLKSDPEPRAAITETPGRHREHGRRPTPPAASTARRRWRPATPTTSSATGSPRSSSPTSSEIDGDRPHQQRHRARMTIDGTTVSDVTVTADLRDLTSDNSFRDGRHPHLRPRVGPVPRGQVRAHRADHAAGGARPRARRSRPTAPATSRCTASPSG